VLPGPEDERTRVVDQYDLGQATYAIMLAATGLGIGTGNSSVCDQDRAREILGVPETDRGPGSTPSIPPGVARSEAPLLPAINERSTGR
jgi:hypothetical protein